MKYKLAVGAVILALIVAAAIYFPLQSRHRVVAANAVPPDPPVSSNVAAVAVHEGKARTVQLPRRPVSKDDANYAVLYAKAVPMQTVINVDYGWRIRHGYSLGMYSNYDDATLKRMAANGDPLAQSVWFKRVTNGHSIFLPGSPDSAEALKIYKRNYQLANSAIQNGATGAPLVATFVTADPKLMHEKDPFAYRSNAEVTQNVKSDASKAAASVIFSEMRGDPSISAEGYRAVSNTYQAGLGYVAGVNPLPDPQATTEIQKRACALARAYYDQAQAERTAQGLGAFDNTPPHYVIGNTEPFPATSICQADWPGPQPECIQTWIQSSALVDGSPTVLPGWECSLDGV